MAQKVITTITDDVDAAQGIESPADETIAFGFGGKSYEIDLGKENAATMRENLGFYAALAREISGNGTTRGRKRVRGPRNGDIRAWAREQGTVLSDRGRIPGEVVAQYESAHA